MCLSHLASLPIVPGYLTEGVLSWQRGAIAGTHLPSAGSTPRAPNLHAHTTCRNVRGSNRRNMPQPFSGL